MMKIFTATVKNYSNKEIQIAVDSSDIDFRTDLRTAAQVLTGMPLAAIRLHNPAPVAPKTIKGWEPIRNCVCNNAPWAWANF